MPVHRYFKFFTLATVSLLTACSTLGPHGGSVQQRSVKLSTALQQAYHVPYDKANAVSPLIIQSADQYHVPAELIAATIRQESNFHSQIKSTGGAVGLAQIIPSYWSEVCPGNLYDDSVNIYCNAYILAHYKVLSGSWFKASAYYNVGPTGYRASFFTRHKAKKYARSVRHYKKQLKQALP
ncbi:transglycosylase SLT domain-containing protein [Acinetobacter sp. B5B]|uniref:transglycosylase SLT domain-containing protein n=1 Tax=Acinetobacter baretiae TaxID=2605383 RepID=UPI0018C27586|nr:transglycosylase SLT domain-containing protein [Acinetobacter baretiae]MBF7682445.1 transglycosylase SLT domain-containing protein [Acinetobacter baretiae]MBF7685287.1 transglycosylase SLT domain-containing protein [Acinetobacter baretiae]